MFCDEVVVSFTAGRGGDGCVSYRREAHRPKGGPDGGDGGKGAAVVLRGNENLNTLYDFNVKKQFTAEKGGNGSSNDKRGRGGRDLVLDVPLGTKIFDDETGEFLADIVRHNQEFVVAEGGRGGFGNAHFKSSTRQLPSFAEMGEPGEFVVARMELQLVADVAIVGIPSAGKSTLISRISDARPKIGDYPFTTLIPNLGVVSLEKFGGKSSETFVVADIPGLIEGASEGKGLGDQFLRHISRAAGMIHLIDVTQPDFLENYEIINKEIANFNEDLAGRKQFVVFNKIDAITEEDAETAKELFLENYPEYKGQIYTISAVAGKNLKRLVLDIYEWVQENIDRSFELDTSQPEESFKIFKPHLEDERVNLVEKLKSKMVVDPFTYEEYKAKVFKVTGKRLEQIVTMTNEHNREARERVYDVLGKMNVYRELRRQGIELGDVIEIAGKDFFYRGD